MRHLSSVNSSLQHVQATHKLEKKKGCLLWLIDRKAAASKSPVAVTEGPSRRESKVRQTSVDSFSERLRRNATGTRLHCPHCTLCRCLLLMSIRVDKQEQPSGQSLCSSKLQARSQFFFHCSKERPELERVQKHRACFDRVHTLKIAPL